MKPLALSAGAVLVLFLGSSYVLAQEKYSVKTVKQAPPKAVQASVAKLLSDQCAQVQDSAGTTICEVWFRKEVPANATAGQIKNGITYRELPQTEILGVVQFSDDYRDYRKQRVKKGTYTMRLGFQPQDGDHVGASPFQEFIVVVDAAKEKDAKLIEPEEMIQKSQKSIGTGHPGVFMLIPAPANVKGYELKTVLGNHVVLNSKIGLSIDGKSTGSNIGVGVTVVGAAP